MTQGRKSRTVPAIGLALMALAGAALLAPASAGAQAAEDEYNLTLPSSGGDNDPTPTAQSSSGSSVSDGSSSTGPSAAQPAAPAATGSEQTPAATASQAPDRERGGQGGGRDDRGGHGGGASKSDGTSVPSDPATAPAVGTGTSDGGAPFALIALAVVAAGATGVAVWRLRRRGDGRPPGVGAGTAGAAGETR
jgi:cobalamin biosynthesis Mg chelatase CobN